MLVLKYGRQRDVVSEYFTECVLAFVEPLRHNVVQSLWRPTLAQNLRSEKNDTTADAAFGVPYPFSPKLVFWLFGCPGSFGCVGYVSLCLCTFFQGCHGLQGG